MLQKVENFKISRNVKYSLSNLTEAKILIRSIINNKILAKDVHRKKGAWGTKCVQAFEEWLDGTEGDTNLIFESI